LLLFVSSGTLFAANPPPNLPSGQDAGSQAKRFRDESADVELRATRKREKAQKVEVPEQKEQPLPSDAVSFVLTDIKITGATLFKSEDLQSIYQPYLQKKVSFKDLQIIAETIKAKYHAKGYLTTNVFFPEQEIENGAVEIAILEGKLGNVTVEGNKWFSADFVRKYIHVSPNGLLNIYKLQKDILRLNKFSDLEVKIVISQGKEQEKSDIVLKVKDKFPWHVGMSEDNRGTRLTEKYRTGFYVRGSNVLGLGDTLFANTLFNARTFGQVVSYVMPLGTYGAKLALDMSIFTMKLGKEYKVFDVTGKTETLTPHLTFELALSESFEAYLDLGIDMQSIKKRVDLDLVSDDQLRIPYFAFNLLQTDAFLGGGQTSYSPRFSFGTGGFLGASNSCHPSASRDGTGGFYFKYEHNLRRTQRMPFGSYLLVNSQFQAASHTLPSSEQLQLGGMTSVRGYPEGDYLADVGATLNVDWVFQSYFFPKDWKLPHSQTPLRRMIEPVAFFDLGGGGLYATNSGERSRKFLAGAGGGLRLHFGNYFFIRLEWAKAIGNTPQGGNGPSTFYMMMQSEV
jgi:hemolysin activation/secretion protein